MKIYIFNVTYNFDGYYVAKKCNNYDEALAMLNDFLEKEVQEVVAGSEYNPSVLKWSDDDVTLVYAEGYSTEEISMNYNTEDCAYYRIFEVEI
jgi:hypothetical protein